MIKRYSFPVNQSNPGLATASVCWSWLVSCQLCVQWCHVSSLESVTVVVFILQKSAKVTNQRFLSHLEEPLNISQHTSGNSHYSFKIQFNSLLFKRLLFEDLNGLCFLYKSVFLEKNSNVSHQFRVMEMLDFHCEGINTWGLIHREVLSFLSGNCVLFRINCSKFLFLSKKSKMVSYFQLKPCLRTKTFRLQIESDILILSKTSMI